MNRGSSRTHTSTYSRTRNAILCLILAAASCILLVSYFYFRKQSLAFHSATENEKPSKQDDGVVRVAIMSPFIKTQTKKLFGQWNRWMTNTGDQPSGIPCSSNFVNHVLPKGKIEITYVVFFHLDFEKAGDQNRFTLFSEDMNTLDGVDLQRYIIKKWNAYTKQNTQSSCFNKGILLLSAKTDPITDKTHPDGPCFMFYEAFRQLKALGFHYFFLMEPDVVPIRDYWVERLITEIQKNFHNGQSDFWQMGSLSRCPASYGDIAARTDVHMNGNAVYYLQDPEFDRYMERMINFYPAGMSSVSVAGCATGEVFEGGYDHTLYRFRTHGNNWNEMRYHHKFLYTDVIQNRCEEVYDAWELSRNNPNTYLVHSKSIFYSPEERLFRNLFSDLSFNGVRPGITKESSIIMESLKALIKPSTEITLATLDESILKLFCFHENYKAFVMQHGDSILHPECIKLCIKKENADKEPQVCSNIFNSYTRAWDSHKNDKVYLWTSDSHAAPIGCNMNLLTDVGFVVAAEARFPNCNPSTSKRHCLFKPRPNENEPCRNRLKREFYNAYRTDPEMERVDGVICSHPVSNCEFFMPFNKSLIVYATRMEIQKGEGKSKITSYERSLRESQWMENLKKIASHPRNIIAANNMFDLNLIKFQTGLNVEYIPFWCGNRIEKGKYLIYHPIRKEIFITPFPEYVEQNRWQHPIMTGLKNILSNKASQWTFTFIKDSYPKYSRLELTSGTAIIVLPYQVSMISFFDFYRMSIPIFVPSKKLLISWDNEFHLLMDIPKFIPQTISSSVGNTSQVEEYWLGFSDFYMFPHVIHFDSWDHLLQLLSRTDLSKVSENMSSFNKQQRTELRKTWARVKQRIMRYSGGVGRSTIPKTLEQGLAEYGMPSLSMDVALSDDDIHACAPNFHDFNNFRK
ncbi:hypothetical protein C9374_000696 [Naegleria lovaniensis]|uniref:Uncharacterized protein n=1 Tax=Naegleria lovaniensis TaxID=51637 RepID=A0AA88GWV2_NAELO|nr:uncharacterized protein C9374_000696 [Naegleria lovaniensis]KAG2388532.1 hypothetical protein C9374_000696 [Naegleria lovaniensis]